MKKTILITGFALMCALVSSAQERMSVSGHITDASSGETLIGAGVIYKNEGRQTGAVTNSFGFYSLTLKKQEYQGKDEVELTYSYVGYAEKTIRVRAGRDTTVNVILEPASELDKAVVVAQKESGIQSTYIGALDVPLEHIQNVPVVFGEADVLKAIQLMPGVQGGNEGFTGLYVRGGGPDENLILLDGVPIYNVDHMLGLFSVFQPEAVKKVTLYKGAFPARYGGRISSIIDIRTNDGNMKDTHGNVGIGLLSDKLHLEGPIIKDKLSYSVSGRVLHSFLFDPLIRKLGKDEYGNYFFFDLNGKLTWRISDLDRLYLGIYHGRDVLKSDFKDDEGEYNGLDKTDLKWGNSVASLRWNHIFSNTLFSNTTVAWNQYRMFLDSESTWNHHSSSSTSEEFYSIDYRSGIKDYSARTDFDWTPDPAHMVKFGAEYTFHTYIPERVSSVEKDVYDGEIQIDTTYNITDRKRYHGHDLSVYAEDDISLGEHLSVNPGIHVSWFLTQGKSYLSFQPRMSARYRLDNGISFKAGYARMAQYTHLLSSAQLSLPIDLWVPITKNIEPVYSDQYSAGIYYDAIKGWEFSVEGYWKAMKNVLEYKSGIIVLGSSGGWEDKVSMGTGRAMGLEFFAQKTAGKVTGWIAYTLAKSDRLFSDGTINQGKRFPYKYDRRHNFNISLNYDISKKVDLSATWSIASGNLATIPERRTTVGYYNGEGMVLYNSDYISERNNFRLPVSHRLNLSVNLHRIRKNHESVWTFSVYNAYNQMNPNFVFSKTNNKGELVIKKMTILPILPSVSYSYKF